MNIEQFNYDLPEELIAQQPAIERCKSRLLHFDIKNNNIFHRITSDLVNVLDSKDVLVFNNTKVINARLFGHKGSGGKVEILVNNIFSINSISALLKTNGGIHTGFTFHIHDYIFEVTAKQDILCEVKLLNGNIYSIIDEYGELPLPPYIENNSKINATRYQTVFAKYAGAVAAPTAGLHFDNALINALANKGIQIEYLTLHVGAGTFLPVKSHDIHKHKMHKEYFNIDQETANNLNIAKKQGKRIIAVGTTVTRALEAAYDNQLQSGTSSTDIFIYPGYEFKFINSLLTNFHLPKSTLLMLVSAFAGIDNIKNIYQEAILEKYRFFSYGDLMFLERNGNG